MEAGYLRRAGYTSRTGCPAKVQKASKVPVTDFQKNLFLSTCHSLLLFELTPILSCNCLLGLTCIIFWFVAARQQDLSFYI